MLGLPPIRQEAERLLSTGREQAAELWLALGGKRDDIGVRVH
jgi:hypothetical protein